jgi:hypothetical protein
VHVHPSNIPSIAKAAGASSKSLGARVYQTGSSRLRMMYHLREARERVVDRSHVRSDQGKSLVSEGNGNV